MPTGYTADLYEGKDVTFEDFVMGCSRAFGALMSLRDEPNASIPDEFKVGKYYYNDVEEAKSSLAKVEALTLNEAAERASKDYTENVASYEKNIERGNDIAKKYNDMLQKVNSWEPPTTEHFELKKFMIEQLELSIEADGMGMINYYENALSNLTALSAEEYKEKEIENAKESLKYAEENLACELEVTKSRTEWVTALRNSLS